MVKKTLIAGLAAIILSLCCGLCFAADNNGNSINLGNEITQSIDKTGQSFQNMTDNAFSTNMVNTMKTDAGNMGRSVTNGVENVGNNVMDGMNRIDDGIVNTTGTDAGNYNTTRTTAETTRATGFNTMSTTTWMWIILAVAAIIVIAAIWYYATQNND